MRRNLSKPLLAGVILLSLVTLLYVGLQDVSEIIFFAHGSQHSNFPFQLNFDRHPESISPELKKAGLLPSDEALTMDNQPITGWSSTYTQITHIPPGRPVAFGILRDGRPMTITAALRGQHPPFNSVPLEIFGVVLQIVFPTLCFAIGMWVLLSRPTDIAAWWVWGILQYVVTFFHLPYSLPGPAFDFSRACQELSQGFLIVSAVWFGLTFPVTTDIDRKWPWVKWIITGVAIFTSLTATVEVFIQDHAIDVFRIFPVGALKVIDKVELYAALISISLMCAGIFDNYFGAANADVKRRLRVVLIGSQVGLWPVLIIVLIAQFTGKQTNEVAPWQVFVTTLALFMVFPLSLAYSIIVERAMDVRILVRQGSRYALARGSLYALQAALGAAVYFAVSNLLKHRERSSREKITLALIGIVFMALRFAGRDRARLWIDRRFFREQYSTELLLSELSREAGSFTETQPLLDTITRRIADTLHVDKVVVLLRSPNGFRLQCATGFDLPAGFLLAGNTQAIEELELEKRPATVYFDRPDDWLVRASESERTALREMNAEILLPLPGRQRLMGVMALGPKRSEQPYSSADLQLLTSVGAQTGMAVENSTLIASLASEAAQRERLNREIEIAREVQERLFPQSFPEVAGIDIAGHCRPALAVGGDYYDCVRMPSHDGVSRLGIAIGDISGKGISAALLMASLRASLRSQTLTGSTDVAHMMGNVNTLLYDASDTNRYATFFFAVYETVSRRLFYVNGGHNAPAVLRRDASAPDGWHVFRLEEGGPVVGLLQDIPYVQQELQMLPGDLFVSFTDGISEAMDHDDEEWGEERLILEAEAHADMDADTLLKHLFAAADAFANGAPQHDDMTLVLMKLA